ncbi:hypothetical protein OnM2_074048, partial [Erysiphe neolycopersici]
MRQLELLHGVVFATLTMKISLSDVHRQLFEFLDRSHQKPKSRSSSLLIRHIHGFVSPSLQTVQEQLFHSTPSRINS